MYLDLIDDPWTLTDHAVSLSDYAEKETVMRIDARKDPRIVCCQKNIPWFRTRSNRLPSASFPFRSHGEIQSVYYLPTPSKDKQESDFKTSLGIEQETYRIIQEHSVRRYTEEMADDILESQVNDWINWSVRLFQEITESSPDALGDDFTGITRRPWKIVAKHITELEGQEAPMSLIVQLAKEKNLRNALKSISRTPRKILERIRENMKVARIQQMDGACIREYARCPGYNAATKAGPKQELLALNRIENTDILENRVYVWVLETLAKSVRKYIRENQNFSASERFSMVRRFGTDAISMRKAPSVESISTEGLVHPIRPNYPLQLDRRYHEVYRTYQRLRQDEKVYDDAWEWQRVIWACTTRLVFYSLLQNILTTQYTSFVYLKKEGIQGRWLNRGEAPGPFVYQKTFLGYLIDAWDLSCAEEWLDVPELFPGAHDIGRLGCDAIFYFPGRKKLLLIWFAFGTSPNSAFQQARLRSCKDSITRFIGDLKRQDKKLASVDGLVLTSHFQKDYPKAQLLKEIDPPKTFLLMIPSAISRAIPSIQNCLLQIIEEFVV